MPHLLTDVSHDFHCCLAVTASFGLHAQVVELQRPSLSPPDPHWLPDVPELPVFPSAHDPQLDGRVELLRITLA